MELLERLEAQVDRLLQQMDSLRAENARICEELAALKAEKAELEAARQKLQDLLTREETRRVEALKRLDALLRRIQEYDSVE
ncbi:MAG: cell division protein ZapB [Desulfovibrionaceae bacterium]|nr:cell division protein ZapB [Desulfovibrionaceae bacterium]